MDKFIFAEHHEHDEGADLGGFAVEKHTFEIVDGNVTHNYNLECGDNTADCYGLSNDTLDRLNTRENAIGFIASKIADLKVRLARFEKCQKAVIEANSYADAADYAEYEEETDDEEEEEEDEDEEDEE